MKVLSVYNIKGGVGKTSTVVNLAYLASLGGSRVLLWDLDPQAATTYCLRIKAKIKGGTRKLLSGRNDPRGLIKATDFERFDLLPGDFSYRKLDILLAASKSPVKLFRRLLKPLEEEYDLLFFDCAPGISTVSEVLFEISDRLILPTIPAPLSVRTVAQLEARFEKKGWKGKALCPFFNMVDRRKSLHRRICEDQDGIETHFLKTSLPYTSLIEQMGVHRAPVPVFAPRSQPAEDLQSLWQEISQQL